MFNLEQYKANVEKKLEKVTRHRESKVEKDILEVVNTAIENNEPATIKSICDILGKRPQQIHQTVRKSSLLTKTKVKGRTLVIPVEG
jgi:hypothetical protein